MMSRETDSMTRFGVYGLWETYEDAMFALTFGSFISKLLISDVASKDFYPCLRVAVLIV